MGEARDQGEHDQSGVHGHGAEQRGEAGRAEGALEADDADGALGQGRGDERAGGVLGKRGGGVCDGRGFAC